MVINTKVLIPNKSWIVENGVEKIATLNKNKRGYTLVSRGKTVNLHDLTEIKERFGITIPEHLVAHEHTQTLEIYGYPVKNKPYNPVWSVKQRLPIYAKSTKSKSLFCAGYYVIKFPKMWLKSFCPKLVTLERYPFKGPYKTLDEAKAILKEMNQEDHT